MADGDETGFGGQLAEAREVLVGVHGRLPHARALREDLQRAAAEIRRPPDRLVDAAGARDVGSQQHGWKPIRRYEVSTRSDPGYDSSPVASPVRTRFAPSPTGLLHVGGVRTALFSWLYARHNGGRFVLRIEDTDETREHPEAIEQIQRSLRWVGLEWDEGPGVGGEYGPYIQSERRPRHLEVAERFLAEGRAYRCYCTAEELAGRARGRAAREPAVHLLAPLPRAERGGARAREAAGDPSVIRLRVPDEGACVVEDLVRGSVRFEYAQLGDHVIVRSDGVPTYNFANPIDDARHADHARDPRRGSAQLDAAPGARAPGAGRRRCRPSRICRCSSAPTASASRSGTARPAWRSCARPATWPRPSSTSWRCSAGTSTPSASCSRARS